MKHFCSFSEAIREGAKLKAQGFDTFLNDGGTCALGAGLEAEGVDLSALDGSEIEDVEDVIGKIHPYMTDLGSILCPVEGCQRQQVAYVRLSDCVMDLNDDHKWTREAIADWLEKEEEKLGFVTVVESVSSISKYEVAGV